LGLTAITTEKVLHDIALRLGLKNSV
jgi:hypothetical protein